MAVVNNYIQFKTEYQYPMNTLW